MADPFPPARHPSGAGTVRRRRKWRRVVLGVTVGMLAAACGSGAYLYEHLNGNIHAVPLFAGTKGDAGKEKPDPFGRSPINILVIGSDGRSTAADCKLGGDCGPGANADVEMVVHVSADRSNATVMSVPRDTMTQLPACNDRQTGATTSGGFGQINSTLAYGPGCTVAAVHELTGIPIDHFVMVDFTGVVAMSDAVGGVSVCVSDNVFDPYSHLKLAKGTHTLKGLSALEFVRSRHAFGDGSDLGRTYAQHAFLSAVIRAVKGAGVLTDPTAVYSLADAATKALTVDTGLGSIDRLLGLAGDVNKVPTGRITFTTMQTAPDPSNRNRVVVAPAAQYLFAAIAADQSLSTATGAATGAGRAPTSSPSPSVVPVDPARIRVWVQNASGYQLRATDVADALRVKGFSRAAIVPDAPLTAATTTLAYGPGRLAEAKALAAALGLPAASLVPGTGTSPRLTLQIGADWDAGTTFPGGTVSQTPEQTRAALDQAHARAATTSSCVPVSTQKTVVVNGIPMSPIQAFSDSPTVAVSAP